MRVAYWRNPEKLQPFLKKGDQCLISGELTQREYQANDGTTKASLELNANIIDLVGGKREGGQNQNTQAQAQPQQTQSKPKDNFDEFDNDIPFN